MSYALNRIKYWIIAIVAILVLVLGLFVVHATAASNIFVVTNAMSGERLYSGNDIQEAFAAAERGSIISVGRNVTVTEPVIVRAEVMISGQSFIKFSGEGKLLLTGDGAVYVENRLAVKRIGALYDYSEIDYSEESGGYVYFLVTKYPSLDGHAPSITNNGKLLGSFVDEEISTIYLDADADGITTYDLTGLIAMTADNADVVTFTVTGSAVVDGKDCISNGSKITANANNQDTKTTATRTYTIVLMGDVNCNGRLDAADASLIMRVVSGEITLDELAAVAADTDRDGVITAADAEAICKKYVRIGNYTSPLLGEK